MSRPIQDQLDTLTALRTFAADENGATAIEYGILAGLIALAIIGTVNTVGEAINTVLYGKIATALSGS
jgi:pilus assembly protein Flp/PilA